MKEHIVAEVGGNKLRCRLTFGHLKDLEAATQKAHPDLDTGLHHLAEHFLQLEVPTDGCVQLLELAMVDRPADPMWRLSHWFEDEPDLLLPATLARSLIVEALDLGKKNQAVEETEAHASISPPQSSSAWASWVGRLSNYFMRPFRKS